MSNDSGLDEAVDCLVKAYDANRNTGIDAIRAKVRGCAEQYEIHFAIHKPGSRQPPKSRHI
jgi:hypothetical protein